MIIGVQNIVTSKHATYLEFPPLGFEPRFGFWPFTKEKLVFPGEAGKLKCTEVVFMKAPVNMGDPSNPGTLRPLDFWDP